ncbi:hypothetical protein EV122DRAFT_253342 [Schizophyllum commune]
MRDPDSPWRCSHEECPDPAYPNKKTECRTYKTKREVHRQKYHCTRVTVVYNAASASATKPEQTVTSGSQTPGKRKRSSSSMRTSRDKRQQRDPESSDSEEGLKIEIEKLKTKIRKQKLRGELRDLATRSAAVSDSIQGPFACFGAQLERQLGITTDTSLYEVMQKGGFTSYRAKREEHCQKHHSVHVTVDYQGCPDSDGNDDVAGYDEAIDDHSAVETDGDNQSTSDNSVISVSDDLESSPPPRPPLRAGPASLMRRSNGQFAPRNSGSASTSNTPATASTQKPQSTVASGSQMPRKRKRTSYESPAMSTRAGKKRRRDPELPSDSEEDLKRQVEELEKQLRKHKLRKELRDLAGQLDDLKRASG